MSQPSAPAGTVMLDEIRQQARLAADWAGAGGYRVDHIAHAVASYAPASVTLIARGTSDNAAGYAKYLLEIMGGYVVSSASPSAVTLYGAKPRQARSLCIAVSQSGQSPDLLRAMSAMREAGSLGIAVTNDPAAPLAVQADFVVDLAAGVEHAVAATKTFTCELLALLDLATAICGTQAPERAGIAGAIASVIAPHADLDDAARLLGSALASAGHLLVVSRGASTPIAHEGALKIMETVGLPALSYSAADLEHGPIACVHAGTPVIVIDSAGPAAGSLAHVIARLVDLGAEVIQVGSGDAAPGIRAHIPVPRLDPLVAPIAEAIPLQLLAHRLATAMGHDPDQPPGLTKVTRTS
ncbi:MAG: SIS domain-containing protein [Actinomycetales bacterium]|nr:SIS domain-containing protein [Actinomycetales bacterium]